MSQIIPFPLPTTCNAGDGNIHTPPNGLLALKTTPCDNLPSFADKESIIKARENIENFAVKRTRGRPKGSFKKLESLRMSSHCLSRCCLYDLKITKLLDNNSKLLISSNHRETYEIIVTPVSEPTKQPTN